MQVGQKTLGGAKSSEDISGELKMFHLQQLFQLFETKINKRHETRGNGRKTGGKYQTELVSKESELSYKNTQPLSTHMVVFYYSG